MLTHGVESQQRSLLCVAVFVLTEKPFDVQDMESAAIPHPPLPIQHQVDFNGFMENTGMPHW